MGIELPELGVEVFAVIVSLADAGLAVCDCNHRHPVQKTGVFELEVQHPPVAMWLGVQQLCARIMPVQQVCQPFVGQAGNRQGREDSNL